MTLKTRVILGVVVSLVLINTHLVFSEEQAKQEQAVQSPAIPDTQAAPETQWVWGEVVSLDTQNRTILVKYLDYETDQEKEISVSVDDKTTYENISSIDELKPKDAVSIDYIVSPEGKNIAKNISIEKPENKEAVQEGAKPQEQVTPPQAPAEEQKTQAQAPGKEEESKTAP